MKKKILYGMLDFMCNGALLVFMMYVTTHQTIGLLNLMFRGRLMFALLVSVIAISWVIAMMVLTQTLLDHLFEVPKAENWDQYLSLLVPAVIFLMIGFVVHLFFAFACAVILFLITYLKHKKGLKQKSSIQKIKLRITIYTLFVVAVWLSTFFIELASRY